MPRTSEFLRHREHFAALCDYHELDCAVEVGTHHGEFAEQFLRRWVNGYKLWCVDNYKPWQGWPRDMDRLTATIRLAPYLPRVQILEMESADAARLLWEQHTPMKFIYIDADHLYESVKRDIDIWWNVLRKGGVLAGHDYCEEHDGVRRAVVELEATGVPVYLTRDSRTYPSWYCFKPDEPKGPA